MIPWDEEEEVPILKKLYPRINIDVTWEDLGKIFPHRTIEAIRCKANTMGLKVGTGKKNINRDYYKKLLEIIEA